MDSSHHQTFKIFDGLYVGDENSLNNIEMITSYHITHLINLSPDIVHLTQQKIELSSLTISGDLIQSVNIREIIDFIQQSSSQGQSCLIVQSQSTSKSFTLLCWYLMERYQWGLYKCLQFLSFRITDAQLDQNHFKFLEKFQKILQESNTQVSYNWNEKPFIKEQLILRNTFVNSKISLKNGFSDYQRLKKRQKKNTCRKVQWKDFLQANKRSQNSLETKKRKIPPTPPIKQYFYQSKKQISSYNTEHQNNQEQTKKKEKKILISVIDIVKKQNHNQILNRDLWNTSLKTSRTNEKVNHHFSISRQKKISNDKIIKQKQNTSIYHTKLPVNKKEETQFTINIFNTQSVELTTKIEGNLKSLRNSHSSKNMKFINKRDQQLKMKQMINKIIVQKQKINKKQQNNKYSTKLKNSDKNCQQLIKSSIKCL